MQSNKKIVFAEDDKIIARLTTIKLKSEGFDVFHVDNGDAVINKMKEIKPDLVLLDIMMPGKDGLSLIKEIKQNETFKNIPVILLTSLSDKASVTEGLKSGAVDYILKPFRTDNLIMRIRNQLK